jgi:hypothetical protein
MCAQPLHRLAARSILIDTNTFMVGKESTPELVKVSLHQHTDTFMVGKEPMVPAAT